jgi:hypothetical protein
MRLIEDGREAGAAEESELGNRGLPPSARRVWTVNLHPGGKETR